MRRAGLPASAAPRSGLPRAGLPRAGLVCAGLVCLALLAACGRKGDLVPPEGEAKAYTWPKHYPAPQTVVPAAPEKAEQNDAATSRSGFAQPQTLPAWDPSRTTTTIYGSQ